MSGSGKSTAVRALEDEGYFCIDNLPVLLLPKLVELLARSAGDINRLALVIDAREGQLPRAGPGGLRRGAPGRAPSWRCSSWTPATR